MIIFKAQWTAAGMRHTEWFPSKKTAESALRLINAASDHEVTPVEIGSKKAAIVGFLNDHASVY